MQSEQSKQSNTQYLTVHGHFYQPPREDPADGSIRRESGAAPFHDFNEKILTECYRPNARLGNFARMSFDIGPTLGLWMRRRHPLVLSEIVSSDRDVVERTGYGNALMQSFHHTILPLASERDRRTELRWGRRWFEHTFGRSPAGIWLPETAVDLATLEACADEGLRFTILSPEQTADSIDPRRPYQVRLPNGSSFSVVFYDGGLSGAVSFQPDVTDSAPAFVERELKHRFADWQDDGDPDNLSNPLVLIATDGEVYGHHHPFKDLFLRDLLESRAAEAGITPVGLEHFLRINPPIDEVALIERSSWGCPHDLLRWRGDCDCTPGDGSWKTGLRAAFDELAGRIDELTNDLLAVEMGLDPWKLRDDWVDVVIGASTEDVWLARHGLPGTGPDKQRLTRLMRAQQSRLAMYASCAFYWDDLTRIEAGYGVRSALHAAGISDRVAGNDYLVSGFTTRLGQITGWKSEKSAAELYAAD